jgi:heat shock protein HslJ
LPPLPLSGTRWLLESYSLEGDGVSSVIAGTTITAEFAPDGKVTGNAGCNRYFASYEVSGDTMTIGPAGSTKMYCSEPEGVMDQEARYLTLLESTAGYRIDGDQLNLLDEAGKTLLSYRAGNRDQP